MSNQEKRAQSENLLEEIDLPSMTPASLARMVPRNRIRSVLERRTSATLVVSGAPSAARSGLASTRNSSLSILTERIVESDMTRSSAGRASGDNVEARMRPRTPKATSLPVSSLNSAARRSSSRPLKK